MSRPSVRPGFRSGCIGMFVILLTLRLPNPGGVATKRDPRGPLRTLKCGRYRVFQAGELAERSNAAVLKTVSPQGLGGSNPSLSARPLHPPPVMSDVALRRKC